MRTLFLLLIGILLLPSSSKAAVEDASLYCWPVAANLTVHHQNDIGTFGDTWVDDNIESWQEGASNMVYTRTVIFTDPVWLYNKYSIQRYLYRRTGGSSPRWAAIGGEDIFISYASRRNTNIYGTTNIVAVADIGGSNFRTGEIGKRILVDGLTRQVIESGPITFRFQNLWVNPVILTFHCVDAKGRAFTQRFRYEGRELRNVTLDIKGGRRESSRRLGWYAITSVGVEDAQYFTSKGKE